MNGRMNRWDDGVPSEKEMMMMKKKVRKVSIADCRKSFYWVA
jgi:hypothetical protein